MSSDGMPRTRSSVSTRSAVCDQITSGTYRSSLSSQNAAQHAGVGAFALQVELGGERVLDLGHDLARADLVGAGMGAIDERRRRPCSRAMSPAICFSMSGRSTLTTTSRDDAVAVRRQRRRVHLRDRGRRQRRGVELRERLADRPLQRVLDDRARGFAVERRDAVLQQRQFLGDVRRHQVAARGQDLPELDEDRAELLQRQAQARAARHAPRSRAEARGTNGRASFSQRSTGVSSSRSSRR